MKLKDVEEGITWIATHSIFDEIDFRLGTIGDRQLVAEWIGVGRLIAQRDGTASRFESFPGADPAFLQKVRRGSAAMLLRHLQGKLSLHGSAISLNGSAIIFTGPSGSGKSTMAAVLTKHLDAALLSDDVVAIDDDVKWVVRALEEDHWLDSRTIALLEEQQGDLASEQALKNEKRPIRAMRIGSGSFPLVGVIELTFRDDMPARLIRLTGADALGVLIPQIVRFAIDDPSRHKAELDRIASMASRVSVLRLERPRHLDEHGRSIELVASLLNKDIVRSP